MRMRFWDRCKTLGKHSLLAGSKRMPPETNTGEATPSQNTAREPINPITFSESDIAKFLKTQMTVADQSAPPPADAEADEPTVEQETTEESPDVTPEDQADEVLSDATSEEEQPEESSDSRGVQKRIDKLTARAKEAQERAEATQRELDEARTKLQELEQVQAVPPVAASSNPMGNVWELSKLDAEYTQAREVRKWCARNQDGAEVDGKIYTPEQIRDIRDNVDDLIEVHIPRRAKFLEEFRAIRPVAEKVYPWLKDRSSADYQLFKQVLQRMPQISQLPEHQILIGDFIEGQKARLAREKTAGKPTTPVKAAPKQPGVPKAIGKRADPTADKVATNRSKFMKDPSVNNLAELLKGL